MDVTQQSTPSPDAGDVTRRCFLAAASALAGGVTAVAPALAETAPTTNFGAPLVELFVPSGALTLPQRSDLIKGVTDVVVGALKLPPDPARRMFVEVIETAEGGFGVNGQVFVPPQR